MPAMHSLANNVRAALTSSITSGATSFTVAAAAAPNANPPAATSAVPGILTIVDSMSAPNALEVVTYTGRVVNGDGTVTLTGVTRGREGTVAQAFNAGAAVFQAVTADVMANTGVRVGVNVPSELEFASATESNQLLTASQSFDLATRRTTVRFGVNANRLRMIDTAVRRPLIHSDFLAGPASQDGFVLATGDGAADTGSPTTWRPGTVRLRYAENFTPAIMTATARVPLGAQNTTRVVLRVQFTDDQQLGQQSLGIDIGSHTISITPSHALINEEEQELSPLPLDQWVTLIVECGPDWFSILRAGGSDPGASDWLSEIAYWEGGALAPSAGLYDLVLKPALYRKGANVWEPDYDSGRTPVIDYAAVFYID
jgi:hypothetical protein